MYSCLAGFAEPGESFEDAVRREVRLTSSHRVFPSSFPLPALTRYLLSVHRSTKKPESSSRKSCTIHLSLGLTLPTWCTSNASFSLPSLLSLSFLSVSPLTFASYLFLSGSAVSESPPPPKRSVSTSTMNSKTLGGSLERSFSLSSLIPRERSSIDMNRLTSMYVPLCIIDLFVSFPKNAPLLSSSSSLPSLTPLSFRYRSFQPGAKPNDGPPPAIPFRLPPRTAIAGVLASDWAKGTVRAFEGKKDAEEVLKGRIWVPPGREGSGSISAAEGAWGSDGNCCSSAASKRGGKEERGGEGGKGEKRDETRHQGSSSLHLDELQIHAMYRSAVKSSSCIICEWRAEGNNERETPRLENKVEKRKSRRDQIRNRTAITLL